VLSFNLLAQDLLRLHSHLYHECDTDSLSWEARSGMLREELLFFNADIICLQEAQVDHFTAFFQPLFSSEGFQSSFFPRVGRTDGCAVAFKTSVFSLVDENALINLVYACPEMHSFGVGNVAQIMLLRHLATDRVLCVANTHIFFNPSRCDVKLLQVRISLSLPPSPSLCV
jgi:mRNA deadenylase 3'-5' endonuclease subunit Ccr4